MSTFYGGKKGFINWETDETGGNFSLQFTVNVSSLFTRTPQSAYDLHMSWKWAAKRVPHGFVHMFHGGPICVCLFESTWILTGKKHIYVYICVWTHRVFKHVNVRITLNFSWLGISCDQDWMFKAKNVGKSCIHDTGLEISSCRYESNFRSIFPQIAFRTILSVLPQVEIIHKTHLLKKQQHQAATSREIDTT